jgi:hypothetical protein
VPAAIVYDRTKTVVRRHVAPGQAVPLHPEAVAFAGHYDFAIDVLAAYRPTGKGRVERQVTIVRDHVLAGRGFASIEEMDAAFLAWVPHRRSRTHRTHGEVIGVRAARYHAALRPIPAKPYVVADRHLRHVGKDCLVAYAGNLYSVPARRVRHRQLVEIRTTAATVAIHATVPDLEGNSLLATPPARCRARCPHRRRSALGRAARWPHPRRHHRRGHRQPASAGEPGQHHRSAAGPTHPGRRRAGHRRRPPAIGLRPHRRHQPVHTYTHPLEGRHS